MEVSVKITNPSSTHSPSSGRSAVNVQQVNVHDAKTHFSRLLDRVAEGETVVIAKAGKPVAKLTPLDRADEFAPTRLGFLRGQIDVPDDFDRMGDAQIAATFE
jgi:prevent-host-death family protein